MARICGMDNRRILTDFSDILRKIGHLIFRKFRTGFVQLILSLTLIIVLLSACEPTGQTGIRAAALARAQHPEAGNNEETHYSGNRAAELASRNNPQQVAIDTGSANRASMPSQAETASTRTPVSSVGDASLKIEAGMTRDQVISILGKPHAALLEAPFFCEIIYKYQDDTGEHTLHILLKRHGEGYEYKVENTVIK